MANWCGATRTNYFHVTDREKFQKIIDNICSEDRVYLFEHEDMVGFGCYDDIYGYYDEESGEYLYEEMISDLQEILVDGEAIMITTIGNEKLRYLTAYTTIITKTNVDGIDLMNSNIDLAREMLGNQEYETEMFY